MRSLFPHNLRQSVGMQSNKFVFLFFNVRFFPYPFHVVARRFVQGFSTEKRIACDTRKCVIHYEMLFLFHRTIELCYFHTVEYCFLDVIYRGFLLNKFCSFFSLAYLIWSRKESLRCVILKWGLLLFALIVSVCLYFFPLSPSLC